MNGFKSSVLHSLFLTVILLASCSSDNNGIDEPITPPCQHVDATLELMKICEQNAEVKALLEQSIKQAKEINPDRRYNPAQTLDEFYDFID